MPPSPGKRWDSSMTAMPWGQKKNASASSQSHTVMNPPAATTGTRFIFVMATTQSHVRSHVPRTRRRCGVLFCTAGWAVLVAMAGGGSVDRDGFPLLRVRQCRSHFREHLQMTVDICLGVRHRQRPLLVPPVRLCHHAPVGHGEPVVRPEIFIHVIPVAIIAHSLRIE